MVRGRYFRPLTQQTGDVPMLFEPLLRIVDLCDYSSQELYAANPRIKTISTSSEKKGAKRRCEFTFRKWTEGKRAWLVVACIALMTPYSDHQFRAFR